MLGEKIYMIEISNINKVYKNNNDEVVALKNINLKIKEGEFISIIGPSGSGKSTLLHILGGLDSITSGKILIDGIDIINLKEDQLSEYRRKQVGIIFQKYNLLPILNVEENIILPAVLEGDTVDADYLNELIDILGLNKKVKRIPCELSGGEQQRVAIARALIMKPSIVLADEPTGNVVLVQHYPKETPVILLSLSTRISEITERQRVRFSSRVSEL